jgi:hypothetical protein
LDAATGRKAARRRRWMGVDEKGGSRVREVVVAIAAAATASMNERERERERAGRTDSLDEGRLVRINGQVARLVSGLDWYWRHNQNRF